MIAVRPPNEDPFISRLKIMNELEDAGIYDQADFQEERVIIEQGITQPNGSTIFHISVQTVRDET